MRMQELFDSLPMKIPPEQQVFGQISKASFDKRINKILDLIPEE